MATAFQKGLFGGDPVEIATQQQRMWSNMYASAQSPYEKMGIALGQLGGAVLGGETPVETKAKTITSVLESAQSNYTPGTAEYFKYVAENIPPEYSDSRAYAISEYQRAKKSELDTTIAVNKQVKENPETVAEFAAPLAQNLLSKARSKGWNPEDTPVPETPDGIKAFATLYGLDKDPDYRRYQVLQKIAEKEGRKEVQEEEKRLLTMESIQTTINKNKADLGKIASDKFEAGARWNEERNSAIELFKANNIDPRKPLKGSNLANTELVNAQRIALRDPWTGKSGSVNKDAGTTTGGGATPPPAGSVLPMPASKLGLQKDKVYATPNGNAKWDGSKFTLVTQ
jgi:hypothetical protein